MRRRHLLAVSALAALVPAGAAVASAPPDSGAASDTTPPESGGATTPSDDTVGSEPMAPTSEPAASAPVGSAPAGADESVVYDEDGDAVATIAVVSMESGWTDWGDDDAPEEGKEYVRVVVFVSSTVTDGSFGVSIGDFVLQDAHGFLDEAEHVPTAAQADNDEDVVEEADLANGESVELALTFEVDPSIGAESVFYHPDDDRLVDVAEVA